MINNILKINFIAALLILLPLITQGQTNDDTIVWPGDVNNNGVVNHIDALYMGAAYGWQGEARDMPSIEFAEALVPSGWQMEFPNNGLSLAYADCDGNGVIEEADLAAIAVNYGLEHSLLLPDSFPIITNPGNTELFFNTGGNDPIATPGQFVSVAIDLGEQNFPLENFYGLAFSIEVDTNYIDMETLVFDFESSWVDPQNEGLITYQRRNNSTKTLDIVLSRRTMNTVSGGGEVGVLSFIIEGNVPDYAPDIEVLTIKDVYVVDEILNQTHVVEGQGFQLDIVSPIKELPKSEFSIYPNPVSKGICTIDGLDVYEDVEIRLLDVTGREMKTKLIDNNLLVGDLPTGIYFININTPQGILTEKIFINN